MIRIAMDRLQFSINYVLVNIHCVVHMIIDYLNYYCGYPLNE